MWDSGSNRLTLAVRTALGCPRPIDSHLGQLEKLGWAGTASCSLSLVGRQTAEAGVGEALRDVTFGRVQYQGPPRVLAALSWCSHHTAGTEGTQRENTESPPVRGQVQLEVCSGTSTSDSEPGAVRSPRVPTVLFLNTVRVSALSAQAPSSSAWGLSRPPHFADEKTTLSPAEGRGHV